MSEAGPVPGGGDAPVVIRVESLSKTFPRAPGGRRPPSLKALLAGRLGADERRAVLCDVDLEVRRGECLALLGANGSGKTTLLRLLAGIYRPDAGRVATRGRVATLLELGTGFHDELTARENVLVNAALLGLAPREAAARVGSILAFAGLADRETDPLRTLSSGMVVRLGFSVAVHLDPDVLLVDEVLSVGDVAFRKRSLERIAALRDAGCTIVFASHEAPIVERLATRAVLLEAGRLLEEGSAADVARGYFGGGA